MKGQSYAHTEKPLSGNPVQAWVVCNAAPVRRRLGIGTGQVKTVETYTAPQATPARLQLEGALDMIDELRAELRRKDAP